MGSQIRPYFEALLLFLLAAGFYTLAATGRLGPAVVAVGSAAFVLRAVLLVRGIRPRLPARWIAWATLLYGVFYLADVYAFSRSFMDATAHLVVFIAIVKLFSAQQARDYVYLCIIALLEILSAATLTVSSGFLVFFLLFVVLMVATFVAFEVFRAEERAAVVARGPEKNAGRLRGSLFGFSLLLTAGVVVFGTLIFFLLPRNAMSGWVPPLRGQGISGFSDEVRLGDISSLQESDQPVMHIRVLDSQPKMGPGQLARVRWRGRVLSLFDGHRWYSPFHGSIYPTSRGRMELNPVYLPRRRELLEYSVTLEPIGSEVLFFPAQLLEADTRFRTLGVDSTGTVVSPGRGFGGTIYSGVSDLTLPTPAMLRNTTGAYPERIQRRYLELPPRLDARIPQLARQVTARKRTEYGRMRALELYLRSHYRYTLHDLPGGRDPLADFLFRRKAGYCEYFASALAVMGRTLGIPTRVVNGFVTGQYNDISGEYVLRGRDAHSWVEAWFPVGPEGVWVPFDGTSGTVEGEDGPWSRAMLYLDAMSTAWQNWVINYDWLHQIRLAHQVQAHVARRAEHAMEFLLEAPDRWQHWLTGWVRGARADWKRSGGVGLGLVLGLLLAGLAWWRLAGSPQGWVKRRRVPGAAEAWSAHQASAAWQRLQRLLRKSGYVRKPAETAEEFARRLEPGPLREAVEAFVTHYQEARFGHEAGALARIETQFLEVRHCLRGRSARSA